MHCTVHGILEQNEQKTIKAMQLPVWRQ